VNITNYRARKNRNLKDYRARQDSQGLVTVRTGGVPIEAVEEVRAAACEARDKAIAERNYIMEANE